MNKTKFIFIVDFVVLKWDTDMDSDRQRVVSIQDGRLINIVYLKNINTIE